MLSVRCFPCTLLTCSAKEHKWIFCAVFVLQKDEFPGETELPPGLRGRHQPADQPGAVCLLRLLVHGVLLRPGRPGPGQLRQVLPQAVPRGARARGEADGPPEQERGQDLPAGRPEAGEGRVGQWCRGSGGRPAAGEECEPVPAGPAQAVLRTQRPPYVRLHRDALPGRAGAVHQGAGGLGDQPAAHGGPAERHGGVPVRQAHAGQRQQLNPRSFPFLSLCPAI